MIDGKEEITDPGFDRLAGLFNLGSMITIILIALAS